MTNRISGGVRAPQEAARRNYWTAGNDVGPTTATWLIEWHVDGVDWSATSVVWSVDGTPFAARRPDRDRPGADVGRTRRADGDRLAVR